MIWKRKKDMLIVILPDGSRREFDDGVSAYDVAAGISGGLARAAIAAEVDGELRDLHAPLAPAGTSPAARGGGEGAREIAVRIITKKDPEALEVVADLLSTDAVKVQPGFPVLITGWGGDAALRGRVRLVEPAGFTKISALGVEEQRVNVLIDFDADPGGAPKLGDGYRVEVSIIIWERHGVLKVPTSALFRAGETWAVFAVQDGRAVQTAIQVGQRNAIEGELLSGMAEGDDVIVHPGDTVAEGVAVTRR